MEQIKKCIDFLGISYPLHNDQERHSFQKSGYLIPKEIIQWFGTCVDDFTKYLCGSLSNVGCGLLFTYIKSCQYAEHLIEQSEGKMRKELTIKQTTFTIKQLNILRKENEELNSFVYNMLDEIKHLKEHNNCLSERILFLENQLPLMYI